MLLCINTDYLPEIMNFGHVDYNKLWIHFQRITDEHILYIIISGNLYVREGTEEYPLSKGDMFILEPNIHNKGYKASCCHYFYIHFKHPGVWRVTGRSDEEVHEEMLKRRISSFANSETAETAKQPEDIEYQGRYIKDMHTDKGSYAPSRKAKITLILHNPDTNPLEGKIKWLDETVYETDRGFSLEVDRSVEMDFSWEVPEDDFIGYAVEAALYSGENLLDYEMTALDVSSGGTEGKWDVKLWKLTTFKKIGMSPLVTLYPGMLLMDSGLTIIEPVKRFLDGCGDGAGKMRLMKAAEGVKE